MNSPGIYHSYEHVLCIAKLCTNVQFASSVCLHVKVDIDVCYRHAVLALWLLCNAGTVGDQQVHHGVGADEDSGCRRHAAVAQRHAAIRCTLSTAAAWGIVGTHVALQLCEGLAVHATQMTH